jgi:hypothetical protein
VGAKVAERRGGQLRQLHAVQGLLGLVGTQPLLLDLADQLLAPCLHLLAVKPPQHQRERRHVKLGPTGRHRLEGATSKALTLIPPLHGGGLREESYAAGNRIGRGWRWLAALKVVTAAVSGGRR